MKIKTKIITSLKYICIFILTVCITFAMPLTAEATLETYPEYLRNIPVSIVGSSEGNVKAVDLNYDENTYISMRDMAELLNATQKAFDIKVTYNSVSVTSGVPYEIKGGENVPFASNLRDEKDDPYNRKKNAFSIDEKEVSYYTIIHKNSEGVYDCYITPGDFALLLDIDMWYNGDVLNADPDSALNLNLKDLEADGYFEGMNAVLLGDASSGEVIYEYNGDLSFPLASITKLMTYAVVMDAVTGGRISLDTVVTFSENVEKLSYSVDHAFHMQAGDTATLEDLIYGSLMQSSNECSLALAEAVSGSEERFVEAMNLKAAELGMSDGTFFYNCNGLPVFSGGVFSGKKQNHITAEDLFILSNYLLSVYPRITEITACSEKYLESMSRTVMNSNPMLKNVDDVVGLKTGTTNKAGSCLVSAKKVSVNSENRYIVAIVLGAEDGAFRNNVSQTLLSYGTKVLQAGDGGLLDGASHIDGGAESKKIPRDAESLARLIVRKTIK
ncbi:MAG: D-alanyl-D-alanine carboxypeptidase [Lachnospiraceae bacterium]|nr:D-alanyl-D-alanine carboxypeptidase [Lachnospiraceae bacterium]